MFNLATQIRIHSANSSETPSARQEVTHQLNEIRVEINNLRNNNVDYSGDASEYDMSKASAQKMITRAQSTILRFADQSIEAQANQTNERTLGLLV